MWRAWVSGLRTPNHADCGGRDEARPSLISGGALLGMARQIAEAGTKPGPPDAAGTKSGPPDAAGTKPGPPDAAGTKPGPP